MLKVKLVSPEKMVASGQFVSAIFPSYLGYLDVGRDHTTLLTELKPGVVGLRIKGSSSLDKFFVSGGYAHIKENTLMILGDAVEPKSKIDLPRAKAAAKRAAERLAKTSDSTIEIERALAAQERARARIKACEDGAI